MTAFPENMTNEHSFSYDELLDALVDKVYFIADDFLSPELTRALREDVLSLNKQGMAEAGIGRGEKFHLDKSVRSDKTQWLDGSTPAQEQFLKQCNELRIEINRQLFMGLYDYEAHYAVYEPGSFYQKHLDAFKGRSNRLFTNVVYLNDHWEEDWGGELAVYDENDQLVETVLPKGGRAIFFLSERFPHEVLKTMKQRLSIAGWYRVNNNTGNHLDPSH